MRTITIYGAQNSGTRWFCNLISKHPQVKSVEHCSIPSGDQNPAAHRVAAQTPGELEGHYSFLFVVRDANCVRGAWRRKGKHNKGSVSYFEGTSSDPYAKVHDQDVVKNYNLQIKELLEWVGDADIPYTFGSYETMLQFKESYLRKILIDLKLDADLYPWNIINSQEKYAFLGKDPSNGHDPYFSRQPYCLMEALDGNEKYFSDPEE